MVESNTGDVYNPTDPFFGNTYLKSAYATTCPDYSGHSSDNKVLMVDWVYTVSASYDLRNTMLKCTQGNGVAVYSQAVKWGACNVQ